MVAVLGAAAIGLVLFLGGRDSDPDSRADPVPVASTAPTGNTGEITSASSSTTSTSSNGSPETTASSPNPIPEPATTSTTITTLPEAEPEVEGEGAEDPVPLGQAIELGTWRVGISGVELDGTQTVLDFVDFNDPPAEGHQFVLVELSGVSLGSAISQPVFDWALVNDDFAHVPEGLECGVLPNSIYDVGDVAPGTQFTAVICFEIPSSEIDDNLLLSLDLLDRSQPTKFFLLR